MFLGRSSCWVRLHKFSSDFMYVDSLIREAAALDRVGDRLRMQLTISDFPVVVVSKGVIVLLPSYVL